MLKQKLRGKGINLKRKHGFRFAFPLIPAKSSHEKRFNKLIIVIRLKLVFFTTHILFTLLALEIIASKISSIIVIGSKYFSSVRMRRL